MTSPQSMHIKCTKCQTVLSLPVTARGQKVRCTKCQAVLQVPGSNPNPGQVPNRAPHPPAPQSSAPQVPASPQPEFNPGDPFDMYPELLSAMDHVKGPWKKHLRDLPYEPIPADFPAEMHQFGPPIAGIHLENLKLVGLFKKIPNHRFWFCPGGLVWEIDEKPGCRRWLDLDEFLINVEGWSELLPDGRPFNPHQEYVYSFRPDPDQDLFSWKGKFGSDEQIFGDRMQFHLAQLLLPYYRDWFHKGEELEFGIATLDRDGIGVSGAYPTPGKRRSRQRRLYWDDVGDIDYQGNVISIFRRGNREQAWAVIMYANVSHPTVFLELAMEKLGKEADYRKRARQEMREAEATTIAAPPPQTQADVIGCPKCAIKVRIKPEYRGKTLRCPKCKADIPIPATSTSAQGSRITSAADLRKLLPRKESKRQDVPAYIDDLEENELPLVDLPSDLPAHVESLGQAHATLQGGLDGKGLLVRFLAILIMIGAVIGFFGFAMTSKSFSNSGGVGTVFAGLACMMFPVGLGGLIYYLYSMRKYPPYKIWFCRHGLAWKSQGKMDGCRWEEIERIYVKRKTVFMPQYKQVRHEFGLVMRYQKEEFRLDQNQRGARTFGEAVDDATFEATLPIFWQRVEQGETLDFDTCSLNANEFIYRDKHIPWHELEKPIMTNGFIVLTKVGEDSGFAKTPFEVSHGRLFFLLAQYLWSKSHNQQLTSFEFSEE